MHQQPLRLKSYWNQTKRNVLGFSNENQKDHLRLIPLEGKQGVTFGEQQRQRATSSLKNLKRKKRSLLRFLLRPIKREGKKFCFHISPRKKAIFYFDSWLRRFVAVYLCISFNINIFGLDEGYFQVYSYYE